MSLSGKVSREANKTFYSLRAVQEKEVMLALSRIWADVSNLPQIYLKGYSTLKHEYLV